MEQVKPKPLLITWVDAKRSIRTMLGFKVHNRWKNYVFAFGYKEYKKPRYKYQVHPWQEKGQPWYMLQPINTISLEQSQIVSMIPLTEEYGI